ncbi:hypothetical protein NGM37_46960, partial [Streptomyces sp. TRM76130]|nr:hypothetical protein [Streptomyces sp. TRM76130]
AAASAASGKGAVPGLPEKADPGFPEEVPEIPDADDAPEIPDAEDEYDVPDGEDGAEFSDGDGDGPPDVALDEGETFGDEAAGSGRRGGAGEGDGAGEATAADGRRPAGEPTAEVSPATVRPGAHVTVSVSCPATGGSAPAFLDAASGAFEKGTVKLPKAGPEGRTSGTVYRGTARIAPAGHFGKGSGSSWSVDGTCPAAHGGKGRPWSAEITVSGAGGG